MSSTSGFSILQAWQHFFIFKVHREKNGFKQHGLPRGFSANGTSTCKPSGRWGIFGKRMEDGCMALLMGWSIGVIIWVNSSHYRHEGTLSSHGRWWFQIFVFWNFHLWGTWAKRWFLFYIFSKRVEMTARCTVHMKGNQKSSFWTARNLRNNYIPESSTGLQFEPLSHQQDSNRPGAEIWHPWRV